MVFKSMTFFCRPINRISSNVLSVYVLDKYYQLYFSRYVDLDRFVDQYYLGIIVIGLAILIAIVAIICEEIRKHTFGYIEKPIVGALERFCVKCYDKLLGLMERFE